MRFFYLGFTLMFMIIFHRHPISAQVGWKFKDFHFLVPGFPNSIA